MKNTKRKSVMLLPESWRILEKTEKETNLNASEIINEILMMYWSRWTNHRKKRLQPYKKAPSGENRTEPELDGGYPEPQQDNSTAENVDKLLGELFDD